MSHPLQRFSGDELYATFCKGKETRRRGRKRGHATDEGDNSDVEGRNVRARLEDEEQVGRGGSVQPMNADDFMQDVRT